MGPHLSTCWIVGYTGDNPILAIKEIRPFILKNSLSEARAVYHRVVAGEQVSLGVVAPLDATRMAVEGLVLEWRPDYSSGEV